nr:hypothetical protein BaRGS_028141 [Batillaria attramentaria]
MSEVTRRPSETNQLRAGPKRLPGGSINKDVFESSTGIAKHAEGGNRSLGPERMMYDKSTAAEQTLKVNGRSFGKNWSTATSYYGGVYGMRSSAESVKYSLEWNSFQRSTDMKSNTPTSSKRPLRMKRHIPESPVGNTTMPLSSEVLARSGRRGSFFDSWNSDEASQDGRTEEKKKWWKWACIIIVCSLLPGMGIGYFVVAYVHNRKHGEWLGCYQRKGKGRRLTSTLSLPSEFLPPNREEVQRRYLDDLDRPRTLRDVTDAQEVVRVRPSLSPKEGRVSESTYSTLRDFKPADGDPAEEEDSLERKMRLYRWLQADRDRSLRGVYTDTDNPVSDSGSSRSTEDTSLESVGGTPAMTPELLAILGRRGSLEQQGIQQGVFWYVPGPPSDTISQGSSSLQRPQQDDQSSSTDLGRTYHNNSAQPASPTADLEASCMKLLGQQHQQQQQQRQASIDLPDDSGVDYERCLHKGSSCQLGPDCHCLRSHHHYHVVKGSEHYVV